MKRIITRVVCLTFAAIPIFYAILRWVESVFAPTGDGGHGFGGGVG